MPPAGGENRGHGPQKGGGRDEKETHGICPAHRGGVAEAPKALRGLWPAGQRGVAGAHLRRDDPPAPAEGAARPIYGDQPHRHQHQPDRAESQRGVCDEG